MAGYGGFGHPEIKPEAERFVQGHAVQVVVEGLGQAGAELFVVGAGGVVVPEVVPGEGAGLGADGGYLVFGRIAAHRRVSSHGEAVPVAALHNAGLE